MKKLMILIIFFVIIGSITVVFAENKNTTNTTNVEIDYLEEKGDYANCDGILTEEGYKIVQEILNWVRILAPIILVLFVAIDFAGAVLSQDNDALKKAERKIIPRMIATALLFFVPTIIRAILSIDGIKDSITISDDPLCNVMKEEINLDNKLVI